MSATLSSLDLDVKNVEAAYAAGVIWSKAAQEAWDNDPLHPGVISLNAPPAVKKLEDDYDEACSHCSRAGRRLVDTWLFDFPLPGDLNERLTKGERFSTEELLVMLYKLI